MHFNTAYLGLVVKELMMGLILAMLAAIPFYFAQSAGVLIDFLRGSSSLGVTDPSTQTQATPIGLLYNYVLIVLFFEINGPFLFFDAVLLSYTVIPVDSFINPAFFNLEQPFWKMMLHLLTDFTAISIQLAAPALVAILMAEMFLGIANRLAPQVQIAFIGMALKSLLGIAMLWAGWFFILQQLGQQVLLWLKNLDRVLHTLSR
jgi:type III secretion protein T